MRRHDNRPIHFAWQLTLIAAPILLLAGIALYSLRQDRTAIEQDARDCARTLVFTLGSQWQEFIRKDIETFLKDYYLAYYVPVALAWPEANGLSMLGDTATVREFEQTGRNSLIHSAPQIQCRISNERMETPVEYSLSPIPQDWVHALSSEQMNLLGDLETALYRRRNPADVGQVLANMKTVDFPKPGLVNTEFGILMLESNQNASDNTPGELVDFARKYPESCSPSGTSLADLALIQALRFQSIEALGETLKREVFRRIIEYPSFLTPEIIVESKLLWPDIAQALEIIWQAQGEARVVLDAAMKTVSDPSVKTAEIWVQNRDRFVYIQKSSRESVPPHSVTLIPGGVLHQAFLHAWETTHNQVPSYISPEVEIGGRSWLVDSSEWSEQIQEFPMLASWEGRLNASFDGKAMPDMGIQGISGFLPPESFSTVFTLNLRLTQPDLLYSSYQFRLWFTAALILAAAVAAWIGIINAWKGYQRQLKLAEMTSNFVSSVSHEFRAPLASMRLMTESLDRGKVSNEQKRNEYFRLIVQECRRLSSLVENVLDFSRIRQGRKRYEFESIDGMALIRETVQMMEPMAEERNLTVSVQASVGLDIQPEWDGPAVQQAVVNLLDNAMKHSPAGSIINVILEIAEERKVQIVIEDQGPGIGEDEQARIFDAFYRLGSELRRETRGIGIGLSIVKHVAEAHGGRVFLKSTPGQGSRFILELPLIPPVARQP